MANFAHVQIRPALSPLQRQLKKQLDDYRWKFFCKDSSGHFPVFVRYSFDATPYLWHFGRKEKIALPVNGRSRAMSEESVPDREIARFELSPSPTQVPVALDVSILSTPAVVQSQMREQTAQMWVQLRQFEERLDKLSA